MQVVIVGGDEVSYSNAPDDGRTWRQVLLAELGNRDGDSTCLAASHEQLQKLYRRSNLQHLKSLRTQLEFAR